MTQRSHIGISKSCNFKRLNLSVFARLCKVVINQDISDMDRLIVFPFVRTSGLANAPTCKVFYYFPFIVAP